MYRCDNDAQTYQPEGGLVRSRRVATSEHYTCDAYPRTDDRRERLFRLYKCRLRGKLENFTVALNITREISLSIARLFAETEEKLFIYSFNLRIRDLRMYI